MQAQTKQDEQQDREQALLEFFGNLPANLQEMILRYMYALQRAEHYRERWLGFRFTGFVSADLQDNVYRLIGEALAFQCGFQEGVPQNAEEERAGTRRVMQDLQRRLGDLVDTVFRLGQDNGALAAADPLNLSVEEWRRSVLDSLRITEVNSGDEHAAWLDEVHAVTADGLHRVRLRTTRRLLPGGIQAAFDPDEGYQ